MKAPRPSHTAQDDLAPAADGQAAPDTAAAAEPASIEEAVPASAPDGAGGAAALSADDDSDEDLNGTGLRNAHLSSFGLLVPRSGVLFADGAVVCSL